jgi:HK97 family phage major capsid protein
MNIMMVDSESESRFGRANPLAVGQSEPDAITGKFAGEYYPNNPGEPTYNPESIKGRLPGVAALEDGAIDGVIGKMLDEALAAGWGWSFMRAIRSAWKHQSPGPKDGFELEVSQELARLTGRTAEGFFVPWDLPILGKERRRTILTDDLSVPGSERRNLGTAAGTGAIATQLPRGVLVDVVRSKMVVAALGGQVLRLTDAPGFVGIPVKTGTVTGAWVAEGASATASNMVVGQVLFTPRTVSATTNVNRRMLSLLALDLEGMILEDLIATAGQMIDAAVLVGSGTSGQPLGILADPKFQSVKLKNDSGNGAVPVLADIVQMESILGQINGDAPPDAKVGLCTSPLGRSALRRVDLGTGNAGARFLWERVPVATPNGIEFIETSLGYRAMATNAIPQNLTEGSGTAITAAILANWSDQVTTLFGPLQLIVNPFLQSSSGAVGVSLFQDVDCRVRRWQAAVNVLGIVTT